MTVLRKCEKGPTSVSYSTTMTGECCNRCPRSSTACSTSRTFEAHKLLGCHAGWYLIKCPTPLYDMAFHHPCMQVPCPPKHKPPHTLEHWSLERHCAPGNGEYGQGGGAKCIAQDDMQCCAKHAHCHW